MDKKAELQERRSHLIHTCDDLAKRAEKENRELTEDELKEIRDYRDESNKILKQIEQIDKHNETLDAIQRDIEGLHKTEERKAPATPIDNGAHECKTVEVPYRVGTLRAFQGAPTRRENDMNAYRSGQWLLAAIWGNQRAARWCVQNGLEVRAQSEGVNTAGGYLVPIEMEQSIIDLKETYGVFRNKAFVLPMGTDLVHWPRRTSGLTSYFVGENTAATESDIAVDNITLVAKKLATLTRMSSEVDEDAVINLADYIANEAAQALAYKEDVCGFTGTGLATHGGIVGLVQLFTNGLDTYVGAVNATAGHDLFSEVDAADLGAVIGTLPEYAMGNAKWYCSKVAKGLVFGRLAASAGGNTIQTLAGGLQDSFLGFPIVTSPLLPSTTSTINNTPMLFFGDLSKAAVIGTRRGIRIEKTSERYFVEDQIAIKATERFDINVHSIGDTTVAGPIVALMGNT